MGDSYNVNSGELGLWQTTIQLTTDPVQFIATSATTIIYRVSISTSISDVYTDLVDTNATISSNGLKYSIAADKTIGTFLGSNGFQVCPEENTFARFVKTSSGTELIMENSMYGISVTSSALQIKLGGNYYTVTRSSDGMLKLS